VVELLGLRSRVYSAASEYHAAAALFHRALRSNANLENAIQELLGRGYLYAAALMALGRQLNSEAADQESQRTVVTHRLKLLRASQGYNARIYQRNVAKSVMRAAGPHRTP
jgi:hypothetical protein